MGLLTRLKHGYDAFLGRNPTPVNSTGFYGYGYRADRVRFSQGNERSIVTSVYNRIAMDCASMDLHHVDSDENGTFLNIRQSGIENCLSMEANLDQTGRGFIQDVVMSMLDEGSVAIVPTVTSTKPKNPGAFDVEEMRVGKVKTWKPETVVVNIYNPHTGRHEDREFNKRFVCLIENPFYAVMNEPNSTLKRLIRKLAIQDNVDEQKGAGKLDLIIQLPYIIKTPMRKQQAENRRKDLEEQLSSSKYGIAYTDGSERVQQLGRSIDNTLPAQVKDLKDQFYAQLGITQAVMNGTAKEEEMQNYYSRTIEPIISAITNEMTRKFLTKTARSKGQRIMFFRDPFELVPVSILADIADRFTRNEILTSNEVRAIIGYRPVDTPEANELRNKNIRQPGSLPTPNGEEEIPPEYEEGYEPGYEETGDTGGYEEPQQ